jgi:hypothetical protein
MLILLTLVLCWIALSVPVALGIARGARIAADREGERRAAPVAQLRATGLGSLRHAA